MVFFTLFMNSGTALGALGGDPRETMQANVRYALYPAFVNGWLDAVPPTVTIVDGFEMAYPHSDEAQYLKHVNAIRNTTLALVAPENRLKYRAQVQAGLAIYLDAYAGMPKVDAHGDVYTDPPLEGTLVQRLNHAVCSALEAADEYVWIYGEQYRWWPDATKPEETRYWPQILPGVDRVLRDARLPFTRAVLRAEKEFAVAERKAAARGRPLRNLLKNGDFNNGADAGIQQAPALRGSLDAKQLFTDWTPAPDAKGRAQRAIWGYSGYGSAALRENGKITQEVKVQPRAFYKLRARARKTNQGGKAVLDWRWQPSGSSTAGAETGVSDVEPGPIDASDRWVLLSATLQAPADATSLIVELAGRGQRPGDTVWFDDVELMKIDVN
jgi:hypothetical protein